MCIRDRSYAQGYKDGYKAGYASGHAAGMESGRNAASCFDPFAKPESVCLDTRDCDC